MLDNLFLFFLRFVFYSIFCFSLFFQRFERLALLKLLLFSRPPAFVSNLTIQRQHFPGDDDQTGAAKALMRLQDTYQLDTEAISSGRLLGRLILGQS